MITDAIENATHTPRQFTFRFIVAPQDVTTDGARNRVTITGRQSTLTLQAACASRITVTRVKTNFFGDMREVPCVDFTVSAAEDFTQTFTLRFGATVRS